MDTQRVFQAFGPDHLAAIFLIVAFFVALVAAGASPPGSAPFDAAFLMSFSRVAELACKPPVRTERNKPRSLFTSVPAQFLFTADVIVIPQLTEHAAKVGKGQFMRLEERLLSRVEIGAMKSGPTRHASHRENL